jgi:hypothetical protein
MCIFLKKLSKLSMRRIKIVLVFAFFNYFGFGQNLVPNPSFEIYDTCPNSLAQIARAIGWNSTRPTPDYFNSCSPSINSSNNVSVPENRWGYQFAATGNAYVGISSWHSTATDNREFIGANLITPLQIGVKYFVSFKVNLYDWNGLPNCSACGIWAINKLGILFSTNPYSDSNQAPICNCAQIFTDSIISDTANWITIKGIFIADSAYTFISIGNFFVDTLTSAVNIRPPGGNAYYFIDDVCVSIDSAFCNNISEIVSYKNEKLLVVYPNPIIDDYINIECSQEEISEIKLMDLNGRFLQFNLIKEAGKYSLLTQNIAPGVYCLSIIFLNSVIKNQLIIKN